MQIYWATYQVDTGWETSEIEASTPADVRDLLHSEGINTNIYIHDHAPVNLKEMEEKPGTNPIFAYEPIIIYKCLN